MNSIKGDTKQQSRHGWHVQVRCDAPPARFPSIFLVTEINLILTSSRTLEVNSGTHVS